MKNEANVKANQFALKVLKLEKDFTEVHLYSEIEISGVSVLFSVGYFVVDLPIDSDFNISADGLYRFGVSILPHIKYIMA